MLFSALAFWVCEHPFRGDLLIPFKDLEKRLTGFTDRKFPITGFRICFNSFFNIVPGFLTLNENGPSALWTSEIGSL